MKFSCSQDVCMLAQNADTYSGTSSSGPTPPVIDRLDCKRSKVKLWIQTLKVTLKIKIQTWQSMMHQGIIPILLQKGSKNIFRTKYKCVMKARTDGWRSFQ